MANICKKCCPRGCCGFCVPTQKRIDDVIHVEKLIVKNKIPDGYVVLHAGVPTANGKYTSPQLTIYRQHHAARKHDVKRDEKTVLVGAKTISNTTHDEKKTASVDKMEAETEVIIIPVEEIVQISFSSEVKKGVTTDTHSKLDPEYTLTHNCCDSCGEWVCENCCGSCGNGVCKSRCGCSELKVEVDAVAHKTTILVEKDPNLDEDITDEILPPPKENCLTTCCDCIRCWCCRRKKISNLIRRIYKKKEREATRILALTIRYSEYSYLHTLSTVNHLPQTESLNYFKKNFNPEKQLQLYLVNDTNFNADHFEVKTKEAELLCRTVMNLKAAKDNYPSESDLDKILQQVPRRIFGDPFIEESVEK